MTRTKTNEVTGGAQIGFVAIGRNEGDRMVRCLKSLHAQSRRVVYVDSGSTDGSIVRAAEIGSKVVSLPAAQNFTAARARNAGFAALLDEWPDTQLVMFIDGDCELIDGFADAAARKFEDADDLGVVTGRCQELYPDATIYNKICDLEWNGPVGEIDACGGIFMTPVQTFRRIDGFNADVIAAEDDEFCIRVRGAGQRIWRIDHDMCLHDADMHRFGQWWRRSERAGHAYAQVGELHPGYFAASRRRSWLWAAVVPLVAIGLALVTQGWSLLILLLYCVSFAKTALDLVRRKVAVGDAAIYAGFLTIAKFPNLLGIINFRRKRFFGRHVGIVEYK